MKVLKWVGIAIVFVVLMNVFFGEQMEASKANRAEKERLKDAPHELAEIPFDSMTIEQKTKLSELFINGNSKPFQDHRRLFDEQLSSAFRQSVKFPETIEYQFGAIWVDYFSINKHNTVITDAENGKYEIISDYKAENKLGQKVRSRYKIAFTYTGNFTEINSVNLDY